MTPGTVAFLTSPTSVHSVTIDKTEIVKNLYQATKHHVYVSECERCGRIGSEYICY